MDILAEKDLNRPNPYKKFWKIICKSLKFIEILTFHDNSSINLIHLPLFSAKVLLSYLNVILFELFIYLFPKANFPGPQNSLQGRFILLFSTSIDVILNPHQDDVCPKNITAFDFPPFSKLFLVLSLPKLCG